MRFRSLGSGSSGNATVVEAGHGASVSRLLIDCGLGIRQLAERLARAGLRGEDIDAVFITHEHADHIGCAPAFARRHGIPLWMSRGTRAAIGDNVPGGSGSPDGADILLRYAADGVAVEVGALQVMPFTVPHDAREPLQLTCSDGISKLGVLTDLGHASAHVLASLQACDALLLECNHDPDLLAQSAYPPFLKARVSGRLGHLSNADAADLAHALAHPGLGPVVAAHLSAQNNRPELARAALALALGRAHDDILVADATTGTDWISL